MEAMDLSMKVSKEVILDLLQKAKHNSYLQKDTEFLGNTWYLLTHNDTPYLTKKQYAYLRSLAHTSIRSDMIEIR